MAFKIWTSDLETWRYWNNRDGTDEELLKELARDEPMPEFVTDGLAWHNFLEHISNEINLDSFIDIPSNVPVRYWGETYEFRPHTETRVPLAKDPERRFEIELAGVTISGRVDGVASNRLLEYKTSVKPPAAQRFADSWQWRVYLAATGYDAMEYFLVQLKADRRQKKNPRVLHIHHPQSVTFYRYPDLAVDVGRVVREFADYTTALGWEGRPERRANVAA